MVIFRLKIYFYNKWTKGEFYDITEIYNNYYVEESMNGKDVLNKISKDELKRKEFILAKKIKAARINLRLARVKRVNLLDLIDEHDRYINKCEKEWKKLLEMEVKNVELPPTEFPEDILTFPNFPCIYIKNPLIPKPWVIPPSFGDEPWKYDSGPSCRCVVTTKDKAIHI